ncbi:alpha/beta fold hydrolase [Micromonospora zamorensis]|uniref:alpha/beta fold hydrolase n=1 Tax=Micromonospora zamorensis TaxID=709883 RepID=UPI0033D951CF
MTAEMRYSSQKSTNDRTFRAPGWVRTSFRLLDRVAPAVGARWAERIWFTLPRATGKPSSRRVQTPGSPFDISVGGHTVVGESWGDGPTVYLVHGWAGNRKQLDPFVAPLVAAGRRVVAFDAPSHGESAPGEFGSRSSSIPELAAALSAVVERHGRASAIVAHSLGATATAVALCDGLHASRIAMLAPMASPAAYARYFARVLGFGERTLRRLSARVERRVGAPMRHFDVPELGRAIATPPTLIIHDREDVSIPVTDGAAIAAAWSGATLHVTTGLGHRRLLRDSGVVSEVVAFVSS